MTEMVHHLFSSLMVWTLLILFSFLLEMLQTAFVIYIPAVVFKELQRAMDTVDIENKWVINEYRLRIAATFSAMESGADDKVETM